MGFRRACGKNGFRGGSCKNNKGKKGITRNILVKLTSLDWLESMVLG